jgi:hypothetical protein
VQSAKTIGTSENSCKQISVTNGAPSSAPKRAPKSAWEGVVAVQFSSLPSSGGLLPRSTNWSPPNIPTYRKIARCRSKIWTALGNGINSRHSPGRPFQPCLFCIAWNEGGLNFSSTALNITDEPFKFDMTLENPAKGLLTRSSYLTFSA